MIRETLGNLLVGESFSPWTQKARWALEYCEVPFANTEYTPTLSEPWLRWRMRTWRGPVSVPAMRTAGTWLRGSWEIACHAATSAGDGRLGDMAVVRAWDELSESALAEGRTRVVRGILRSDEALEESLPAIVPAGMRPGLRWLARDALRRLDRKYAHLAHPGALRGALQRVRAGLAACGGDFLLGRFSYADITMAVVLETVSPIARTDPPMGPLGRGFWHDPALASEFGDLLAWRDRLAAAPATTCSQMRHAHATLNPSSVPRTP